MRLVEPVGFVGGCPVRGESLMPLRESRLTTQRVTIAFLLVVVASVGAAVYAADRMESRLEALSVAGAQRNREASLAGCERSRADRQDAVRGWSTARQARLKTAHNPAVDDGERLEAAAAAAVYREVIAGFRSRIVDCSQAFPPVRTQQVREAIKELSK